MPTTTRRATRTATTPRGVDAVIGANVAAERARRRWKQADLADRLGVARSTVAAIEAGRRHVTVGDAARMCAVFDVPLSALLVGADADTARALFGA